MTDEKEDILAKIQQLVLDIKRGEIENEQVVAELKDIEHLINNNLD